MFERSSRSRHWEWHPEAREEARTLGRRDPIVFGLVVQRIRSLAEPGGDRWAMPTRAHIMVSVVPPVVAVVYVVRRDRQGLGGLVVQHTTATGEFSATPAEVDVLPVGLLDAAELRLKSVASW